MMEDGSDNKSINQERSLSAESSISIPCLIKQPHRQQLTGLIVGDKPNGMASLRGDKFDVKVNDGVQTISKLYVFPNFPPVKKCWTDPELTPSKINPKSRRKRGEGSGYIYWRTIRKNGSEYKQTWYYYELKDKNNRRVKSSEYIPKKLRSLIEQMDNDKVPVVEILRVLRRRKKKR